MRLVLLWLFSVAAVSSSTPSIIFSKHDSSQKSPYLADYSRIDWSLCPGSGNDNAKTYCLLSEKCHKPFEHPKRFSPTTKSNAVSTNCNAGIQIRPISVTRWLFFVQLFVPDLDPVEGVLLFLSLAKSGAADRFKLAKCDANSEAKFETEYVTTTYPDSKIALRHLNVSNAGIMCIFEISHTMKVEDSLLKILDGRGSWQLFVEYQTLSQEVNKNTLDTTGWKTIVDAVKEAKISESMLTNTRMLRIAHDPTLKHEYHFTEAITDFATLACPAPTAMLVFAHGKALYEALDDFYYNVENGYQFNKEGPPKMAAPLEISCLEPTCLSCPPLESLGNCDGCTPPVLTSPAYFKDCPTLTCQGNMWMFENKGKLITRQDEVKCRKSDGGAVGWYRSNGVPVRKASCAPRLSCAVVSPLKDMCSGGGNHCFKIKIRDGIASCKQRKRKSEDDVKNNMKRRRRKGKKKDKIKGMKTEKKKIKKEVKKTEKEKGEEVEEEEEIEESETGVLQVKGHHNQSSWEEVGTSLHCDYRSGIWYSGKETQIEFDHTQEVRCEVLDKPPFTFEDPWVLFPSIFMCLGFCFFTGLFLIIAHCIRNWQYTWAERRLKPDIKKRYKMKEEPEYDDLTVVKDVNAMDEEAFWRLISEFPLYSIHERVKFVENMLIDLGVRVEIDRFLAFFQHCVEMESDHRVWRKLMFGYKILLIAFNQVNRSRVGIKLNENLKRCSARLLRKIGFESIQGEDESLVETRNLCFTIAMITNDRETMTYLLEEGAVTKGREDLKRRCALYAVHARGMNRQDEHMKKWDKTCRIYKEPPADIDDEPLHETPNQKRKRMMKRADRRHEAMMRKLKGDVEKNDDGPKNRAEKEMKIERDWVLRNYGGWREHMIYAICCGRNPEVVSLVLTKLVNGPYTRREILAGFKAAVEDCFDMRFAAKEVFLRYHKLIKEKVPVGTTEYAQIFEMFFRYATLDFFGEENWLLKFSNTTGTFDSLEKKDLPITLLTEMVDNTKLLMKQCMSYVPKMAKPMLDDLSDEEGPPPGSRLIPISNKLDADHPSFDVPSSQKPDPTTRSGPHSGPITKSDQKQGSGKSPNSGPNHESGSVPKSEPKPE